MTPRQFLGCFFSHYHLLFLYSRAAAVPVCLLLEARPKEKIKRRAQKQLLWLSGNTSFLYLKGATNQRKTKKRRKKTRTHTHSTVGTPTHTHRSTPTLLILVLFCNHGQLNKTHAPADNHYYYGSVMTEWEWRLYVAHKTSPNSRPHY